MTRRGCPQLTTSPMLVPNPGRACSHAAYEFGRQRTGVVERGEFHEHLRVLSGSTYQVLPEHTFGV